MSSFPQLPIVRLEIDGMKHTIVKALMDFNDELGEYISAEIERQIRTIDFESMTRQVIRERVQKELETYFGWGDGAKVIREAIETVFVKADND